MGTFICGQAAAREMVKQGYGRIVNIASIAGTRAGSGRYGLRHVKISGHRVNPSSALELAPHGITVNAVAPGPVDTPLTRVTHNDVTRDGYKQLIPVGRYGRVEEMADAAVFPRGRTGVLRERSHSLCRWWLYCRRYLDRLRWDNRSQRQITGEAHVNRYLHPYLSRYVL